MPKNNIHFPQIPKINSLAFHIVRKCLRVQQKEIVRVSGGVHHYPLLQKISLEIRKVGAHPIVNIMDDLNSVSFVNDIPDEYLGEVHPALKELEDSINAELIIYPVYDPVIEKKRDIAKLQIINSKRKRRNQKARYIGMEWPTLPKAEIYGFSLAEFEELYWKAFWVDLDQLTENAEKIKNKLKGAQDVVITSADGSVLSLSIGERPIWIDTGCFTDDLMAAGDLTKNLPCGEVYCSPLEKSAEGSAYFQSVFADGVWIKDLHVTFEKGKITHFDAKEGKDTFDSILKKHTGDKDSIAELGIGINPHVPRTMGNTLLDEKVVGSIHIAIGHNTMYGGINKSSLHWDLVSMSPSISVNGRILMNKGKLNI